MDAAGLCHDEVFVDGVEDGGLDRADVLTAALIHAVGHAVGGVIHLGKVVVPERVNPFFADVFSLAIVSPDDGAVGANGIVGEQQHQRHGNAYEVADEQPLVERLLVARGCGNAERQCNGEDRNDAEQQHGHDVGIVVDGVTVIRNQPQGRTDGEAAKPTDDAEYLTEREFVIFQREFLFQKTNRMGRTVRR